MDSIRTVILGFIVLLFSTGVFAEEEVLKFETHIQIKPDQTIDITESLVVRAEGELIKQGLIRALPLFVEKDAESPPFQLTYTINSIKRDGKKANFQQQGNPRLLILRIFDSGVFLEHGEHTFTISYSISGYQFHDEEMDSFYWHVTGHGWPLPINLAEAHITFPALVDPHTVIASAHTGTLENPILETVVHRVRAGGVHYSTLTPIDDGGGLTIRAIWARGFFKSNELLSVPSGNQSADSDVTLLSVPDGSSSTSTQTAVQLDSRLFQPDFLDQLFAEVRIEPSGDVVVTETIRTRTEASHPGQGLLRTIPMHQSLAAQYAFAGEQELQIEPASTANSFFLVASAPLSEDRQTFLMQYRIPAAVTRHKSHDELHFSLGDPGLATDIEAVALKIYPPELMLPESAIVMATVPGHPEHVVETEVLEDSVQFTLADALPARANLKVQFKIPKGFIH